MTPFDLLERKGERKLSDLAVNIFNEHPERF
jgi:hypothetical protein